jgi:hypothetical protein
VAGGMLSSSIATGRTDDAAALDLTITPEGVLRFLLACIVLLVSAGGVVAAAVLGLGETNRALQLFDLGAELSVPAYFSSLMLLAAGCLLGLIVLEHTRRGRGWRLHWALLTLGFFWLAFDEAASIHEAVNPAVRGRLGMSYLGGAAWTAVLAPVVGVLAALYLPFLLALPRRYMRLFLAAGSIYLGGAVGAELVGEWLLKPVHGAMSWPSRIGVVVEEGCEMLGTAWFIYGLLAYLADLGTVVRLRMAAAGRSSDGCEGGTPGDASDQRSVDRSEVAGTLGLPRG